MSAKPGEKRIGNARHGIARLLIFGLPIALWLIVILIYSAGSDGDYVRSLYLLQAIIIGLAPDFPYHLDNGKLIDLSMYQANAAFRTLAHIVVYAILAMLVVRCVQAGRTRLKRSAFVAALLVSVVYMGIDEYKRWHTAERHAKPIDLILNLIGVALVLGGTPLYFLLKSWERRLAHEPEVPSEEKECPVAQTKSVD